MWPTRLIGDGYSEIGRKMVMANVLCTGMYSMCVHAYLYVYTYVSVCLCLCLYVLIIIILSYSFRANKGNQTYIKDQCLCNHGKWWTDCYQAQACRTTYLVVLEW